VSYAEGSALDLACKAYKEAEARSESALRAYEVSAGTNGCDGASAEWNAYRASCHEMKSKRADMERALYPERYQ